MTTFKAGDYCFNEHGEQAQYVAQAGGGHVVRYMYERGDEEEFGEPTYVDRVYAKAQIVRRAEEVAELEKKAATLRNDIALLRKANAIEAAAIADRQANLKKWSGLATLEAFLENKITHFVTVKEYGPPTLTTFAETMNYQEECYVGGAKRLNGLKLLSLYGDSKGDLAWRVHTYREPSEAFPVQVLPFQSYEAARERFIAEILAAVDKFRANPKANSFGEWIKAAAKHGLAFPEDLMRRQRDGERERLLDDIASKRSALVEVEKKLAAIDTPSDVAELTNATP